MLTMPKPFLNEVIRTFADPADRASIEAALVRARTRLGATYPLVIGGEKIATKTTTASVNPSHPSEVVGHVGEASLEQAGEAIRVATERFASWVRRRSLLLWPPSAFCSAANAWPAP